MIRNILFDMDGVLLDSEVAIRVACIRMLEERGVKATHEDFIPFTGMGENKFIGGVVEKYGLEYIPEMKARAYEIYGEIAGEYVEVFEGIKELVLLLKEKGCKVAVASAADDVKVRINLGCMGLSVEDFDAVVTGSDVTRFKPDPEVFLKAAQRIGAKPGECLVVEDAVSGCNAAGSAGMRCVAVRSSFDDATLKAAGAEQTMAKTVELPGILETL